MNNEIMPSDFGDNYNLEWQLGKTEEDLKFIAEAEKAIAFLQEAIDSVKAGQLTTQIEITPVDLLVKRKELFGE